MGDTSSYGVNDFALKVATVNGTGSASANGLLLQALFRMGVPVSGKNVFPSNIQGLPTWYEIRVNGDGYTARSPDFHLIVAMNPESYARDIEEVASGGWVLYDSTRELADEFRRDDVTFIGIPLAEMCVEHFKGARTRILMKNIMYVGALSALIDIDLEIVRGMLKEKFAAKQHLMDANFKAIDLGYDYAKEHFDCPLPIRLEEMDATKDSVMITGNAAAALGCVYAGATVGEPGNVAWGQTASQPVGKRRRTLRRAQPLCDVVEKRVEEPVAGPEETLPGHRRFPAFLRQEPLSQLRIAHRHEVEMAQRGEEVEVAERAVGQPHQESDAVRLGGEPAPVGRRVAETTLEERSEALDGEQAPGHSGREQRVVEGIRVRQEEPVLPGSAVESMLNPLVVTHGVETSRRLELSREARISREQPSPHGIGIASQLFDRRTVGSVAQHDAGAHRPVVERQDVHPAEAVEQVVDSGFFVGIGALLEHRAVASRDVDERGGPLEVRKQQAALDRKRALGRPEVHRSGVGQPPRFTGAVDEVACREPDAASVPSPGQPDPRADLDAVQHRPVEVVDSFVNGPFDEVVIDVGA